MTSTPAATRFAGAIPALYDALLVPMLFAPYADVLVERLAPRAPGRVLEVAAGTGVVTRRLAERLACELVATDLNQPMLDRAAATGTSRPVTWRQADAMALPFDDASCDAVVCQFGVMFFPDRPRAFAEARRVLRPGGVLLFDTWSSLATNDLARVSQAALAALLPDDPPRFMELVPHGYFDPARIAADLAAGGFAAAPRIDTLALRSRSPSARDAAVAYCQGTPTRNDLEARGPDVLDRATAAVEAAFAQHFGPGPVDAEMCALIVEVER